VFPSQDADWALIFDSRATHSFLPTLTKVYFLSPSSPRMSEQSSRIDRPAPAKAPAPNSAAETSEFAVLGVSPALCAALSEAEYISPTPIQKQAIPPLLAGRDMLGLAQTGTGKTAAFSVPILQLLTGMREELYQARAQGKRGPYALVLAPTRELAIQIDESFRTYGKNVSVRTAVIFGGVGQNPQVQAIARGIDVLVATPGRLLDLIGQRLVSLGDVRFLVLDEADRMLDMGFVKDVTKIVKHVPAERQSLLFSATMPGAILSLASDMLKNPVKVEVTPEVVTVEKIDQFVYAVDQEQKRNVLVKLFENPEFSRVIIFTRMKHVANRVAEYLERAGVTAAPIHGNKSQSARQKALLGFRTGEVRALVATDIAARGIDVSDVSHVINYELPNEPESYVHRIGRTARAGKSGIAIALCSPDERVFLRDIERLTRKALTRLDVATLGPLPVAPARPAQEERRPQEDRRPQQHRGGGGYAGRGGQARPPAARPTSGAANTSAPRPQQPAAPRSTPRQPEAVYVRRSR
jgi:ATP-dependent RNA helicase RhlE